MKFNKIIKCGLILLVVLISAFQAHGASFEATKISAEQGHQVAQYNVGVMYRDGQGTLMDMKKAFYWFEKSAVQGFANAQCDVGIMCRDGQGTSKDLKKALYWFQKCAEQGHKEAQKFLATVNDE